MKCIFTLFLACISTITIHAQNKPIDSLSNDNRYREDQFYFAVTYNLLNNRPKGVSQTGLSNGFHFGFIRDFPLNQRRNMAIGLGLGASINNYNHNIFVYENDAGEIEYINLSDSDIDYSKNKFSTYLLEIPLEFRWRTSTASNYNFWRIYTGFKFGYVLTNSAKYKGDLEVALNDKKEQNYKEPIKPVNPFDGNGISLS